MSVFRRVSFLGFALVPLVVLAACGGDGGDGGGEEAFDLPPPGEYSFTVTGTIDVEFSEPGVGAVPVALGGLQGVPVEGGLRIQLGEDGNFTITGKDGVELVAGKETEAGADGGSLPITFRQNEDKPSTGSISRSGVMLAEFFLEAEQPDTDGTVTTTNEEPVRLESDGNPFSDEGANLATPPGAEPVGFDPGLAAHAGFLITHILLRIEAEETEAIREEEERQQESRVLEESLKAIFTDSEGDGQVCDSGEGVDDPAVDIQSVAVTDVDTRVDVDVGMGQSPLKSAKDFSFSVQLRIGQEGSYQVAQYEVHAGQANSGLQETPSKVKEDTARYATATDELVTLTFPDTDFREGDTVAARAFHAETEGDKRNCDVTDVVPVSELEFVPCGGECTPVP